MTHDRALMDTLTDAQLMEVVQQSAQSGFAALVQRHHQRAYRLAWRVLNDQAEAEDAVQEAFMKIWNNAEKFYPERGNFAGWLTRIVTNCALDRRRSLKSVSSLEDAQWVRDDAPDAERQAEGQDVRKILAAMPPRQRAAIALFYMEGYTMAEVAAAMDSNVKSVESLLSRGRTAFKTQFENKATLGLLA